MTLCTINKLPTSYVIMRSYMGVNANGVYSNIVEPVMVYTNEEKALKKLKAIIAPPEHKYWVWSTPRGK